jgi:hypothetical protein
MTTTNRRCVLCPTTDRAGNTREPNWASEGTQTCEGHYERLTRALEVIPWQWSILSAAPKTGKGGARVTGSSEQSLGVSIPVLDLMGPANTGAVHDLYGDQTGMVSVASILDGWVADWADTRGKGETKPVPTVPRLTEWLAKRLDWAAREHPALDDFAADIRRTVAALRAANGDLPQEDEHKDGIECAKCDRMSLYDTGDFIECVEPTGCGKLLTPSEYAQWVELKGFFLRATIACPGCGVTALAGAHKLDKVECVKAKGGCGYRMTWKQYTKAALTERRPERAEWAVA